MESTVSQTNTILRGGFPPAFALRSEHVHAHPPVSKVDENDVRLVSSHLIDWRTKMKSLVVSLTAAVLMTAAASTAVAVECAEGVRHAGCVGREGAVEVRRPVAEPAKEVVVAPQKEVVVAPKKEVVVVPEKEVIAGPCRIIDGRRVCR
ncbi:hypothetical protein E4Q08_06845 [Candidatus Accumulibacter phosphatis]|jgi:hypothetical protein|uniref:Uncharacterized protein n=1 Tax=Candidatus Accumulibacter contiguus TaxID=2954381 RepID=A0ABX1T7C3_9PROT|nr:hypothetical protein [Candidatus Accumulibacter contiguus]